MGVKKYWEKVVVMAISDSEEQILNKMLAALEGKLAIEYIPDTISGYPHLPRTENPCPPTGCLSKSHFNSDVPQ